MTTDNDSVEGRLDIQLAPARGAVAIRSTRPVTAARLFVGRPIDETLRLLPLLYNVCGQAQAVAAVRATESALGRAAGTTVEQARDRLVTLETVREHLWRVLLDWPRFHDSAPATQQLAPLMGMIQAGRTLLDPESALCTHPGLRQVTATSAAAQDNWAHIRTSVAEQVFADDLLQWLQRDAAGFDAWMNRVDTPATQLLRFVRRRGWGSIGDSAVAALPRLAGNGLLERFDAADADAFVAAPELAYAPYETGALTRQFDQPLMRSLRATHGCGLFTRLAARLVEIARLLAEAIAVDTTRHSDGLAGLEAARGRLYHRIVLDGERVARYQILAPTEWNFGPSGPAVQALQQVVRGNGPVVRAQAELLIHAIDPCVGYRLEIEAG